MKREKQKIKKETKLYEQQTKIQLKRNIRKYTYSILQIFIYFQEQKCKINNKKKNRK